MATAYGNTCLPTAAAVLVAALLSGCSPFTTVQRNDGVTPLAKADAGGQHVLAEVKNVPLPRQDYDGAGERIPYEPRPNPYTATAAPVPQEAKAMFAAASARLEQGESEAAEKQFRSLCEKFPSLSGPWVQLGAIAEKAGDDAKAAEHYSKAIGVNAENVNAYIALGLVQRRRGLFAEAQAAYLRALDVWKDFPEAHLNLAILYDLYANKPEQSQPHYEAYYFLTGEKDETAYKWLVEVKRRTGIEKSFIDNPPNKVADVSADENDAGEPAKPIVAADTGSSS